MTRTLWLLCALALALLTSRFITMAWLPMSDTTEPRYAEIARLMVTSGDWITPWLEPGVPFWGKPPLSFWMQALSMKLFGINDFAARLPAWVATLGILALTARLGWQLGGARLAALGTLLMSTMALTWISAGAVMTDTFLVFGTTLSLVAFLLRAEGAHRAWGWGVFVGLAIGLLAKGPLALVLTGLPIIAWSLWNLRWRTPWPVLPWRGGIILTAMLVLPWYVAAELKTPGFLNYFIIGEHFGRFIIPGWEGDLYGNAHDEPRGMIWLFLLWASFPWGLIGGVMLARTLASSAGRASVREWMREPAHGLIVVAMLSTPLFFTFSGNILWTYLLPSLPFLALIIARCLRDDAPGRLSLAAISMPLSVTALGLILTLQTGTIKSEQPLIEAFRMHRGSADATLHYVHEMPFSARYYGRDDVERIPREAVLQTIAEKYGEEIFLALRNEDVASLDETMTDSDILFQGRRFTLLRKGSPNGSGRPLPDSH